MGGRRLLQLSRGLRDALRNLGELQVGALDHAGFAAALRGADHIAVALAVQLVILRPCAPARAAWAPTGRGMGAAPAPPSSDPPTPQPGSVSSPAPLIPTAAHVLLLSMPKAAYLQGYLSWVHGALRCPPPSPLLQPEPDPADRSVPIRITAQCEMLTHAGTQHFCYCSTWELGNQK